MEGGTTDIFWVETKGATNILQCTRQNDLAPHVVHAYIWIMRRHTHTHACAHTNEEYLALQMGEQELGDGAHGGRAVTWGSSAAWEQKAPGAAGLARFAGTSDDRQQPTVTRL